MTIDTRIIAAILGTALLAGCSTVTEGQYNNTQALVGGSPAVRREVIKSCMAREAATPLAERKSIGATLNIGLGNYPSVFCNRLWNAVAKGRITYTDFRNLSSDTADNSKVIKIMQGR